MSTLPTVRRTPRRSMARLGSLVALSALWLGWPEPISQGVGWSPGERLPPVIVAEINRRIAGSLRVGALSWRIPNTVVAEGVVVVDPDGGRVATCDRVEADVVVSALAGRLFRVKNLVVQGLKLNLVNDQRGLNVARAFAPRAEASGDAPLRIQLDRVRSTSAQVLYRQGDISVAIAGLAVDGQLGFDGQVLDIQTSAGADVLAVQVGEIKLRARRLHAGRLSISQRKVEVDKLDFHVGDPLSALSGEVVFAGETGYDLRAALKLPADYWPQGLQRPQMEVSAMEASLRMTGALEDPRLLVDVEPLHVDVAGLQLRELSASISIDRRRLHAAEIQARLAGGTVRGEATVVMQTRRLSAGLDLTNLGLASLSGVKHVRGALRGRLDVDAALEPDVDARLDVRGQWHDPGYDTVHLKRPQPLRAKLRLRRERVQIEALRLGAPGSQLTLSGSLHGAPPRLDLRAELDVRRPAELLRGWPERVQAQGLSWRGTITGLASAARVEGPLAIDSAQIYGLPLRQVRAPLVMAERRLRAGPLAATLAGGKLQGQVELDLDDNLALRGSLALASAQLARVQPELPASLGGRLDLAAALAGELRSPVVLWTLAGRGLGLHKGARYALRARGQWRDRALRVADLRIAGADGASVARGHFSIKLDDAHDDDAHDGGELDGELRVADLGLDLVPQLAAAGLESRLAGRLLLSGSMQQPRLRAGLRSPSLRLAGESLGPLAIRVCLDGAQLRALVDMDRRGEVPACDAARMSAVDRGARIIARADLEQRRFALDLRARQIDADPWLKQSAELSDLSARLGLEGHFAGAFDRPQGSAVLRVLGLRQGERLLGDARLRARLDGSLLRFELQALQQLQGKGQARFAQGATTADATLHLKGLAPELLARSLRDRQATGAVDGTLLLRYDARRQHPLQADAHLLKARLVLPPAEPLLLAAPVSLSLASGELQLGRIEVVSGGSRFVLTGRAETQALNLDLRGELAMALLQLASDEVVEGQGFVTVELKVEGTAQQPRLLGVLKPREGAALRLRSLGKSVELVGGSLSFDPSGVRVRDLRARGLGGEASLGGRVLLREGGVQAYALRGEVEGVRLRDGGVSAEINADLALDGPADGPRLSGTLELVDGRVFERYKLRNFVATRHGGPARSLEALAPSLAPLQLDLGIEAVDLRARADMGTVVFDLNASADLRLAGSWRDPSLSGVIDVDDGRVELFDSRLQVDSATVDFPERADRRLVPRIDLRASSIIEPEVSPTGAELPVVLTLEGDVERMKLDVFAEESSENLSRVELLSLLATGRPLGALIGETSRDAALRLVSREILGEVERQVERSLQDLIGAERGAGIDLRLESGATQARGGLRWEVSQRLVIEGESNVSYVDVDDPEVAGGRISAGTLRQAARMRWLLADSLPFADSIALQADVEDLSFAANVYSTVDLKLNMRIFDQ